MRTWFQVALGVNPVFKRHNCSRIFFPSAQTVLPFDTLGLRREGEVSGHALFWQPVFIFVLLILSLKRPQFCQLSSTLIPQEYRQREDSSVCFIHRVPSANGVLRIS